jgi:tRNA1Val (adenine37-N6)-methyltransferase
MFRFKQFALEDNRCAHKVGTDGTLLGAWVNISDDKHLLDIGTGSGLIALMLAQRSDANATVDALEFAHPDYLQACENVSQSPWPTKVKLHLIRLQDFETDQRYDHIVSNPPFFNNSFKPPDVSRVAPRHTETLTYAELLTHSKRLLTNNGKLSVILPYSEGLHFIELAKTFSFYPKRQWGFRARKEKPIERWLLEFSQQPGKAGEGEILLYEQGEKWSEDYKALTKDFYLKL